MIKIDLHTHSEASHDGGITLEQYKKALDNKKLDFIAITDHNQIDFALYAKDQLGDKIIVGEEIMTTSGEIIGLFLTEQVPLGLSIADTIGHIKNQGGLVYIPHPFETIRSGVPLIALTEALGHIDIIETINGRAFFGKKSDQALKFASEHKIASAASSDSHGWNDWGVTYSLIEDSPTVSNLTQQLFNAKTIYKAPSFRAILYPKYNKIKKVLS